MVTGWWLKKNILKNDGVRQWVSDDIPYMKWTNNPFMFETTNQMTTRLMNLPLYISQNSL